MRLKSIELSGFKSFAKKTPLDFETSITAIVGPNGSGKSNIAESFRFVLGEQSMKSMRGRKGEDMIWNGSQAVPRSGRASVRLVFDNSDRALNLDFEEVSLERVVHRTGVNEYLLNGSQVRLYDITELLSQANIGASGHHIISQGEADRILSASAKDRREMLEDALGLTAYFYKREEAQRKLQKTAENMKEVEALRREVAPHLRFLQSQVKKIEESEQLRSDITEQYLEYFKREDVYLNSAEATTRAQRANPQSERSSIDVRIKELRSLIDSVPVSDSTTRDLVELESRARQSAQERERLMRELGRLEGEEAFQERMVQVVSEAVPHKEVKAFAQHMIAELERASVEAIPALISFVQDFLRRIEHTPKEERSKEDITARKADLQEKLSALQKREEAVALDIDATRRRLDKEKESSREAEKELFALMTRRSELEGTLARLVAGEEMVAQERLSLQRELGEAGVLLGKVVAGFATHSIVMKDGSVVSDEEMLAEERRMQQERRRKLERLKIRLEEISAGNADDILKEHQETSERDLFLSRELSDLEESAQKLQAMVEDLTATLETRFVDGIEKINKEFDTFFKLMFGAGSALLSVVQEKKSRRSLDDDDEEAPEEVEEGIDISISLPHKRIKGLHMLSGGERALTSIALIFAMSQVNPPPFLILDETDAALDEANSRRYGDMIENLAKKSQLIVITHNRETMSRAGILYGITMGNDGISKLLSVRFEEALAVAK